jgi:SP family sugar:H+ symporter-like MFS transporter
MEQPNEETSFSELADDNVGKIIFLSLVAALGGFLFGFDSGIINGTVEALQGEFGSDEVGTGFNVASMLLGSAVGAFFAGNLADKFGRRPTMILTAVAFIISAWGSGMAGSSAVFVVFRVTGGLAVGAASILAPAYISEIAPAGIRGSLATLQQLMIVVGLFMAFLNNYLIAGAAGSAADVFWFGFDAWQWMFWMEIVPASIFFGTLLLIPESPRYLVAAGREDEAREVINSLSTAGDADAKIADIRSTLEEKRRPKLTDVIMKHTGKIHPLVWVGIGLASLQQLTGINVVFYYGGTLWQAAGFTEASALLTNVINGSVNVIFTFVAIALVDRVGRKPLLLVGSLGQAVMLGIMAYVFGTSAVAESGALQMEGNMGLIALIAANGYIAFFAFSWGPIMWVLLGEMFPNQFRGAALSICGLVQWLTNFLVTMTFPILLGSIGLGFSYGIYAAFGIIAYFFVRLFVQETKGRTLEDMSREATASA